jgi:hypothetical protein
VWPSFRQLVSLQTFPSELNDFALLNCETSAQSLGLSCELLVLLLKTVMAVLGSSMSSGPKLSEKHTDKRNKNKIDAKLFIFQLITTS